MQPAVAPMLCFVVGFVLLVALTIVICYLLTLQKALSRVAPHNRVMEPGSVWILLVPCLNIIWQFLIAIRVPESLRNEFRQRGWDDGSDYGKGIALTQVILGWVSVPFNIIGRANEQAIGLGAGTVVLLLTLAQLVFFIVFWSRIANYSAQLAADEGDRRDWKRRFDDFDDDDDHGPPRGEAGPSPETFREGDPGAIKR